MNHCRWKGFWVAAALAALAAGCSRKGTAPTAPVSGVVTYQGKPATDVRVIFTPQGGRPAIGHTDAEGRFSLTTFQQDDGAVPGTHVATISDRKRDWLKEATSKNPPPPRFPERYQRAANSPWTFEVKSGEDNVFTLEMTDSPQAAK